MSSNCRVLQIEENLKRRQMRSRNESGNLLALTQAYYSVCSPQDQDSSAYSLGRKILKNITYIVYYD